MNVLERRKSEDAEDFVPEDTPDFTAAEELEEEEERSEETESSERLEADVTEEDFVHTAEELQEEDAERLQENSEDLAELEFSSKSREENSPSERPL